MVTDLPIERLLDFPSSPTHQNHHSKAQLQHHGTGKRRVPRSKNAPYLSGQSFNASSNRPVKPPSAVIATSDQESKSNEEDEDLEAAIGDQGRMAPSLVMNHSSSSAVEHRSSTVYSNYEVSPLGRAYILSSY